MPSGHTAWRRPTILLGLCAVVLIAAEAPAAATSTFRATADAYVHKNRPGTNFGKAAALNVDGAPLQRAYVRFKVTGLLGPVTRATLRLRALKGSLGVLHVRAAGRVWSERRITFSNAPSSAAGRSRQVRIRRAGWSSVEVTARVRTNGIVAFALSTRNPNLIRLASREYGAAFAPQLVVETPGAGQSPPLPPLADPAPTCIGEPGDHPAANYAEPRVFLEAQGWWDDRDDDGAVARFGDSEHVHVGLCVPLQQTLAGTTRIDIRVVAHNLPAGSVIRNTRFHDAPGQLFEDIRYERVVRAGETDAVVWRTLNWNSAEASDGLRELRFLTFIDRPDGAEIHASSGWCVDFENGKTDSNYESCTRRLTEGRGWYDCLEYKSSRTDEWTYPYSGIPAGQAYVIRMSGQDGAPFGGGGDDVVTRHWLRLDPSFHSALLGNLVFEHAGAHRDEAVTIPGHLLTPGVHFLFLMTERDGRCSQLSSGTVFDGQKVPQDGIISGGIRIPIKVN